MELRKQSIKAELSALATPLRAVPSSADALMKSYYWWTGKPPEYGMCPGVDVAGKIHSLNIPNLTTCSRNEVMDYFDNSWTITEVLLSGLSSPHAFYRVPYHGLRHPLVFYYLHPAVLYVNKLRLAGLIPNAVNPDFESIFETGVDEMSWDDMSKNDMKWPELQELHKYRKATYKLISNLIQTHEGLSEGHAPITQSDPLWALFMGFEHERIHIETSSVLIRELPIECVQVPTAWPVLDLETKPSTFPPCGERDFPSNKFIDVTAQKIEEGKPASMPHFGWDNEYGHRTVALDGFTVSQNLITNGEMYAFVSSGAYLQQKFWSEQGWKWRSFRNTKFPTFWKAEGPAGYHQYKLRTTFELVAMQWSWPAVVNFYEAEAYCKWLGEKEQGTYRLPTEAEQIRLRDLLSEHHIQYQSKTGVVDSNRYNLSMMFGAERKVSSDLDHTDVAVPGDVFGNVWQWCGDDFNPLTDFAVHKLYDDFSVPCFDGEHQMILGGSFISTGDEATSWARFHFRPHFFQHAGFRVVRSTTDGGVVKLRAHEGQAKNPYETDTVLNEYLTLHFAPAEIQMPYASISSEFTHFPQRCAEKIHHWMNKLGLESKKALEVGCAVGGASFKLAEKFESVTAVDLSQSFIDAAKRIQSEGTIQFQVRTEGERTQSFEAAIDKELAARVEFRRADACALPPEFAQFDAVLMANLLCRLPSPSSCLTRMSGPRGIVREGGVLMLTTPFTWMESFTSKDLWFGGQIGNDISSEEALLQRMSADFELLEKFDMPLLIREHERKYQLIFSLATIWRRK
ncbi:MAG TPA: 5-histidylcysteine sulfoxide synthase [Drouetiella sp.]